MYLACYSDTMGTYVPIGTYETPLEANEACREHARKHKYFTGILHEEESDDGFDMAVALGQVIRTYCVNFLPVVTVC